MPTTVTKIIDPDNGAGTDYTTLEAWETAFGGVAGGNLVTSDSIAIGRIRPTGGSACGRVSIAGWVTDGTHWIELEGAAGYIHKGLWSDTAARITVADGNYNSVYTTQNNVRVTNLQLYKSDNTGTSVNLNIDCTQGAGTIDIRVSNCIFKGVTTGIGLYIQKSSGTSSGGSVFIQNSVFYGGASATGIINIAATTPASTVKIYNCTISAGAGRGIFISGSWTGQETIKNCIIQATDAAAGETDDDTYCDYNSVSETSDTGICGSHGRYSQTFSFISSATGNYGLLTTDTGAKGFGVGPALDALVPTTDIEGKARSGNACDIGADEYILYTLAIQNLYHIHAIAGDLLVNQKYLYAGRTAFTAKIPAITFAARV